MQNVFSDLVYQNNPTTFDDGMCDVSGILDKFIDTCKDNDIEDNFGAHILCDIDKTDSNILMGQRSCNY